jgi:hypothetical protein
VATRKPLVHDVGSLRARAAEEPFRSALLGAWSTTSLEGVLAHHVARPSFVRRIAELEGSRINTDDRALVEFGFARALTGARAIHARDVAALAHARDEDRPLLAGGDVDRDLVADERAAFDVSLGLSPSIPARKHERSTRALCGARRMDGRPLRRRSWPVGAVRPRRHAIRWR